MPPTRRTELPLPMDGDLHYNLTQIVAFGPVLMLCVVYELGGLVYSISLHQPKVPIS